MKSLPEGWRSWDLGRLEAEIREHNRRYWEENRSEISDYDYDRLVEHLRALAPEAALLAELGPTGAPGDPVEHSTPMLSLDKAYDEASLIRWADKFEGVLLMSPKVDGVACSIQYNAMGRLSRAATRGNGLIGENITANVRQIQGLPEHIKAKYPIEIRGEIYLPLSEFAKLAGEFANPRNTAAGALKHKSAEKSARIGLRFFCYDLLGSEVSTEQEKLQLAQSLGFSVVEQRLISREEVQQGYEEYVQRRDSLDFEIDGVVFKANRLDEQARLGATSHHPRYAIAYKLQGESAQTCLRQVEWSVSRTGVLTPVGIVDPVTLSGASVSRISLHNWGFVKSKELSLDAQVIAMRRGGVIPHLESVVEPGEQIVNPPSHCSCGAGARVDGDLVLCTQPEQCMGRSVGLLSHWVKVTGIEGFGQTWLETLSQAGLLRTPLDYYSLKEEQLLGFERMGSRLAQKLLSQIQKSRVMPLATFLCALGIPDLGRSVSKALAERFRSLEGVRSASPEEIIQLPKFAEILSQRVVEGLKERTEQIEALLKEIKVEPLEPLEESEEEAEALPWVGRSFLFTGTLVQMKRKEAQAAVEARGGKAARGVSKALGHLVVGDAGKAGAKLSKAKKLGISILSEGEFIELLEQSATT